MIGKIKIGIAATLLLYLFCSVFYIKHLRSTVDSQTETISSQEQKIENLNTDIEDIKKIDTSRSKNRKETAELNNKIRKNLSESEIKTIMNNLTDDISKVTQPD